MLAINTMSPTAQGILYLAAVVLFLLSAFPFFPGKANLVGLGLACFAFVFMWNAFAAS
jgi:hypothetical protein